MIGQGDSGDRTDRFGDPNGRVIGSETRKRIALIATTAPNKGSKCRLDLLNRLIPCDPDVLIEEPIKNVLLVRSNLPSLLCYGAVISAPPACVRKVFPVDAVTKSEYKEIMKASVKILENKEGNLYVECIKRSGNLDCRTIEIAIGGLFSKKLKIDSKNFHIKLTINILGDITALSLLKPGQEKVSVRSLS